MMMLILFGGVVFVSMTLFALAALRWGVDTRDPMESAEWERRQTWYAARHRQAA